MDTILESWPSAASAVALAWAVSWLMKYQGRAAVTQQRSKSAAAAKARAQSSIAEMEKTLAAADCKPGKFNDATLEPILDVADRIRNEPSAARALLRDVLARAVASTKRLNNVTEFTAPLPKLEAAVAAQYDRPSVGLLQGLPISVKECVDIGGQDTTVGTARRLNQPKTEDAVLVQVLSQQGAVMFARTNIPQTMLSYECSNPVFGATKNPYDLTRGPGGSSGGEGSLLGSNGSILGIGTDIGGSLRIPAAFSGCCSFKPTAGRISTKGMTSSTPGQESIRSTAGPMAREVDGLVLLLRALWANGAMHRLDPTVPPTPFNDAAYPFPPCSHASAGTTAAAGGGARSGNSGADNGGGKTTKKGAGTTTSTATTTTTKPLRVGWFSSDGFAPPTPACARAVEVAKSGLASRGHTVVEFDWLAASGSGTECMTLFSQLIGADQGETLQALNLEDEVVDPVLKVLVFLIGIPWWLRSLVSLVNRALGYTRIANLLRATGRKTTRQVWQLQAQRKLLVQRFIHQWQALELDCVVCPATVFPAPPAGAAAHLSAFCNYTAHFNVMDFPAGVLPVTTVTHNDDAQLASYPSSQDPWAAKACAAAKNAVGLPVGVQVVALPYEDETCLFAMKEVELAVQCCLSGGLQ